MPAKSHLFIGFWIKPSEVNQLQDLQASLLGRRTPPDKLHLSYVFLGDRHSKEVISIIESLPLPHSFRFDSTKLEYGPEPRSPRLVWLRGQVPTEALQLQKAWEKAFVIQEGRDWIPHITLSRFKTTRHSLTPLAEPPSLRIHFDRIHLFRSRVQPPTNQYESLESWTLPKARDNV